MKLRSGKKQEQGLALIVALIMLMLISGLILSYLTVSTSNLSLTAGTQSSLGALYVAETGLARAVHQLNEFNLAAFTPTYNPFDLDTVYTYGDIYRYRNPNDLNVGTDVCRFRAGLQVLEIDPAFGNRPLRAKLTSTGEYHYIRRGVTATEEYHGIRRAVEVLLTYRTTADFNHAVLLEKDLDITGSIHVWGDVHTNGDAVIRGAATVDPAESGLSDLSNPPYVQAFEGNVTAVGSLETVGNAFSISGTAEGNSERVPIPKIDPEKIIARAQAAGLPVQTYQGDQMFNSGNQQADGTWTGPDISISGVVVVNGDVTITGNVVGNAIIIATGNVHVTGNVDLGTQGSGQQSTLMMLSQNDILLTGNPVIHGMLYATNNIMGRGNTTVYGSLIGAGLGAEDIEVDEEVVEWHWEWQGEGRDKVKVLVPVTTKVKKTLTGNIDVHFVRPDSSMDDPFKKWTLVSWREVGPQ